MVDVTSHVLQGKWAWFKALLIILGEVYPAGKWVWFEAYLTH